MRHPWLTVVLFMMGCPKHMLPGFSSTGTNSS